MTMTDNEYDSLPPSFEPSARKASPQSASSDGRKGHAGYKGKGASSDQGLPPSYQPASSPSQTSSRPRQTSTQTGRPAQTGQTGQSAQGRQPSRPQTDAEGQPQSIPPRRKARTAASGSNVIPAGSPSSTRSGGRQGQVPVSSLPSPSPLPAGPGRNPAGPSGTGPQAARRKKAGPGKIAIRVIAALLALILVYLLWIFGVVNSNLSHKDYLSAAADSTGSTWLILGSDARDGTTGGSADQVPGFRTDTIMVLTKPAHGPASLISIPRDSYVQVNGQDSKINAVAELYGYEKLVEVVEGVTGQKIDHVVQVGFGGLETIVNALGGIQLCYDRTVNDEKSGLQWMAGCHAANGQTALAMSRMRYSDPLGDFGRTQRQRMVIAAIMKKASSPALILNPIRLQRVLKAGLGSMTVDQKTSPFTLIDMALAFRAATGGKGVSGTVYYTSQDYQPASGIGSCILLDSTNNHNLFSRLARGEQAPGTVGGQSAS